MAAPANSVESEMATEDYKFLLPPPFPRSFSYFQPMSSVMDELELEHGVDAPYFATSLDVGPFSPSPPRLPFSPWLPQNQEHDDIVHPDASTVTPPYVAGVSDPAFLRLSLDFPPKSSWLPQNQEHDDILVHPNASTVTRKRKRKHRSRKNNGRTSSGVGSDDKFNQGVDESVDGRTIGKLFVSNREIAKGSNGTIVLEGTHEVRPVAVKRLVKAYHDVADKEYQNLCVSDRHSNIVRLYGVEEDQHFVYLALERCTGSLNDLIQMQLLNAPTTSGDQATEVNIEYKVRLQSMKGALSEVKLWEDNGYPSPTLWKLMRDMVSGLVHLHELGMVHRDLKPQNVLIVKEGSLCAKLADMGISKRLVGDKSSLGSHATGCGTSGWRAPELLRHGRQTRAIDVFSLGCVLFYCITGGKHPFGGPLERDMNIVNGKVKLFLVKHIPEAVDLFDHLLDQKAELRPKASEVLIHPMFWDSDKRLSFLRDASDRVQQKDFRHAILKELEHRAPRVLGIIPRSERGKNMVLLEWDKKIDAKLLNDNDKARCYCYDRVHDLLRFIRNKKSHFFELPREIQEILGPVPEGFDGYFRSRFPKLLMEVYKVLHKYCREEEWFSCGTSGWQAPELLRHGRQTRAIDVFSLGCVLFYCITGGKHPFGGPLERDMNIVNAKVKLFLVKHIPEAVDLFDHLLDQKAELRPMASEVLIHPMFWDSDKRLSFLRDASDRVQQEDSGSSILKELERIAPRVLGTKPASKRDKNMVLLNWDKKIDPSLLNDIDNSRWYYYDRVRDLVRFIRNKKNHFFNLPREIQDTLGPVPEGFDGYFRSRFPKLLMEVYKVLHKYCI